MPNEHIAAEIERVRRRNRQGEVDPREVLEFARTHKKSALYTEGGYNWNKDEAAYEHWLDHTRKLIRIHFTVLDVGGGRQEPIRAYFSPQHTEDAGKRRNYVPIEEILSDEERRCNLILSQIDRLRSVIRSYPLPELRDIERAIDRCEVRFRVPEPILEAAE